MTDEKKDNDTIQAPVLPPVLESSYPNESEDETKVPAEMDASNNSNEESNLSIQNAGKSFNDSAVEIKQEDTDFQSTQNTFDTFSNVQKTDDTNTKSSVFEDNFNKENKFTDDSQMPNNETSNANALSDESNGASEPRNENTADLGKNPSYSEENLQSPMSPSVFQGHLNQDTSNHSSEDVVVQLNPQEPALNSITEPIDASFIEQTTTAPIPPIDPQSDSLSLEIDNPATPLGNETNTETTVETKNDNGVQNKGDTSSNSSLNETQNANVSDKKTSAFPIEKAKPETSDETGENKQSTEHKKTDYISSAFLKELFSNGNECITAPGGSYQISDTTRSMLALFSNGRYFVAETHKYDGPPLLFVTDTRRRRLQIGQPEYVPLVVINNIYEYAAKIKSKTYVEPEENNQEQARMQRDFVTIVTKAASSHVSDIHIVVADHTTVMFRVNGLMQTEMEYNKEWGESFVRAAFASADISDANYAQNEYQAAQKVGKTALRGSNGKLMLPKNVQGIRLQFNPIAFGTRYVVMRLLYDEENAESAGDLSILGFEPHEVETFYRLRAIPTGIVIVAGPTGSGKSTTLQRNMISMLQERNYELNLITVEDPPEYPIPGARQMPVTNATTEELKDREFTKALAASLRSDPDALMIGEVRTLSAADLAFRGALSGHSVWTTLHANSAPAILMRLKDMGVEDFKLQDPSIMKGMLSQRLFRKICPYCRIAAKDKLDNPAVKRLHQAFGDIGVELSYLRGPGCKHCEYRGVKGRTVVGEFLLPDATFLDLMIRGESKKALDYWVTELNGRTLREAAQSRMLRGIIDIDEVERWTGLFNETAN